MCSILGYYNTALSKQNIESLNLLMSHRGPDNSTVNEYNFKGKNLYFGHNRLSIQDLEAHANQPMENKRYVIVFNGEVYNHLELRKKLSFKNFKTHSDTETLLYAFLEWGIEETLTALIGMFAIALFDKKENSLYLVRDRVGIKPLYWTLTKGEFAFSSELKGISSHLKSQRSDKALIEFMCLGYTPNNRSYYKNIQKLQPAHYMVFNGEKATIKRYWNLPSIETNLSYESYVEETERLIRSSIRYRLLSDLEVGSFLSGGVDSSLTSAIMQQESSKRIKTFSIGFDNNKYDESIYAKEVANHIGSEHHEYMFTAKDVLSLLDKIDYYYDEPFGDASSLPMMLLSKMTKNSVTVALSGDGGDELFLGYERYFLTQKYFALFKKFPQFSRTLFSKFCQYSNQDKLQKFSYPCRHLNEQNIYSLLYSSVKPWEFNKFFNKDFMANVYEDKEIDILDVLSYNLGQKDLYKELSCLDFNRYLPDDILTKVDRASMAYSLEARVPLLDHRIVELAYSIPSGVKLKYGPKSILKSVLYKYIPKKLVERPKQGFGIPLQFWFRKELKNLLYDKVNSLDKNVFNIEYINKLYNEHIYNNKNYEYILWNILRLK